VEIIGEMYKQLWVAPKRGTGLHKSTTKRYYSRERTRDDSLVLRDPLVPFPLLFLSLLLAISIFEFIPSCNMHPSILKS
jgi:hypothetical protein